MDLPCLRCVATCPPPLPRSSSVRTGAPAEPNTRADQRGVIGVLSWRRDERPPAGQFPVEAVAIPRAGHSSIIAHQHQAAAGAACLWAAAVSARPANSLAEEPQTVAATSQEDSAWPRHPRPARFRPISRCPASSWPMARRPSAITRSPQHRGKPIVLAFYPGDNTAVCTRQLCSYTSGLESFTGFGASVWAISPQGLASHEQFARKYDLAFPLLADEGLAVSRAIRHHARRRGPAPVGLRHRRERSPALEARHAGRADVPHR